MAARLEQLRSLARVVISPQARDARHQLLVGMVMAAVGEAKVPTPLTAAQVQTVARDRYQLGGFPLRAFEEALQRLAEDDLVAPGKDGVWLPTGKLLIRISTGDREFTAKMEGMTAAYVKNVRKLFPDLDKYDEVAARKFLELGLTRILTGLGESIVKFYYGTDAKTFPESTIDDLLQNATEVGFRDEKMRWACIRGLKQTFLAAEPGFSEGFQLFASRWTMLQLARQPGDVLDLRKELIGETRLFLDSNILVSYLCEGSTFHRATKEAIDATRKLEIELCIFDETLDEFRKALDWAAGKVSETAPDLDAEDNEIVRTFRMLSDGTDWPTFRKMLGAALLTFRKAFEVREIIMAPYVAGMLQVTHARQLIREQYASKPRARPAPWEIVEHDARMLGAIQKMRGERQVGLGTSWFLTRQPSLARPDQLYNDRHGQTDYPSTLALDTWFDVIGPFAAMEQDDGKGAKTLARLVGDSYLPILPALSIKDFVHFVGPKLGLDGGEEQLLVVRIQSSPLAPTLQRSINDRDTIKSLEILERITEQVDQQKTRELHEKDETIGRLVSKLKEQQNDIGGARDESNGGIHIHAKGDVHAIIGSPGASQVAADSALMARYADLLEQVIARLPTQEKQVRDIQAEMRSDSVETRKRGLGRCISWLKEHSETVLEAGAVLGRILIKTAGG